MNSTTAPLWCKVPKFEISKDAKIDIPAYGGRLAVRWDPEQKHPRPPREAKRPRTRCHDSGGQPIFAILPVLIDS